MVTVDTKLISLLGYPLKQTFAPRMFNETFKKLNMDYFYFPIEVENDKLEAVVNGIRCMNYAGFNVTKPNKIKILDYLDELDGLAEKIGSVNVVAIKDGRLTNSEYDEIMATAYSDQVIDKQEKNLLAQLQEMLANKTVVRVPDE